MKKVLICGDRNWTNWKIIYKVVKILIEKYGEIFIIEGGARGADTIAKNAAIHFKQQWKEFPAEWDKYGKGAGPIRNQQMLNENQDIEIVIAFHSDLQNSKGTKDMVNRAKKKNIKVCIFTN